MAKSKPTHAQAQLLLQLFDLRREEKLRKARDWYANSFWVDKMEDVEKAAPRGSEENAYVRMVVGYWEQACMFLNQGLLDPEQFFTSSGEFYMVWAKVEPVVQAFRDAYKNPAFFANLETAAKKFEKWQERRAPGSQAVFRQHLQQMRDASKKKES